MRCKKKWIFDYPAQLSVLGPFRQHVQEVYSDPAMSKSANASETAIMVLALNEVLVNIIKHASCDPKEQGFPIRLEASLFEDRMEWLFSHGMAFFSPKHIPEPREGDFQSNGYGLYIIDQVADRVDYFQNEQGKSCVRLSKWFHPERAAASTGKANL
jgi:anti-sigma regulatory factor (Ser/Thr protein kinase)